MAVYSSAGANISQKVTPDISVLLDGQGKKPYANDASYNTTATFQSAVLGHLLYTDGAFDLRPGLLESWAWDFKNKWYTLELRKNLKFHNGRAVTAKDLEFSLSRGFYSKNKSFYRSLFGNIAGVDKIIPGTTFQSGKIEGIKVIDPYKLRVTLKYPNPSFLHNLSYSYFSLVPIEELKEDYFTWKALPVGAGPYKVILSDEKSSLVRLQNADDVPEGAPHIIDIRTEGDPKNSELILWPSKPIDSVDYQRDLNPIASSVATIIFNFQSSLGKEADFRKAVSLALDRASLTKGANDISPLSELLPQHFWGRSGAKEEFSVGAGNQLFAKLAKRFPQISNDGVSFIVRSSEVSDEMAKNIKLQLEKAGLKVNLLRDKVKFWKKEDTTTTMTLISIAMADVDPLLEFGIFKSDSPLFPFVPMHDDKFNKLYLDASQSSSLESRAETVRKLSQYFVEERIVVPIYDRKPTVYFKKAKVKSLGQQDGRLSFYFNHLQLN